MNQIERVSLCGGNRPVVVRAKSPLSLKVSIHYRHAKEGGQQGSPYSSTENDMETTGLRSPSESFDAGADVGWIQAEQGDNGIPTELHLAMRDAFIERYNLVAWERGRVQGIRQYRIAMTADSHSSGSTSGSTGPRQMA